jgi:hypothetical protein
MGRGIEGEMCCIAAMIANFTKPEKLLFTKRNLENI